MADTTTCIGGNMGYREPFLGIASEGSSVLISSIGGCISS